MTDIDHNKIITKTATVFFKNHGIKRKGQSRTFFDDNCWFTTIIEFQPNSREKGTFLNVGVNFHWYNQDYFSFDIGNRQSSFIEFRNETQFESEVEKLCKLALEKVAEYNESFKTLNTSREKICNSEFASDSLWGNYHKGTVSGLIGDFNSMKVYYENLLSAEYNFPWVNELKERTKLLLEKTASLESFKTEVEKIILETRKLKKLDACQPNL